MAQAAWIDQVPEARACRRSPDVRIPPRHAGRRWNRDLVRRPSAVRLFGSARTFARTLPLMSVPPARRIVRIPGSGGGDRLRRGWRDWNALSAYTRERIADQ